MGCTETIKTFTKAPGDGLDYVNDFTKEMARVSDAIASSSWTVPSSTSDDVGNVFVALGGGDADFSQAGRADCTSNKTIIWISGGILGESYTVTNKGVTVAGREYERQFMITIAAKSGV